MTKIIFDVDKSLEKHIFLGVINPFPPMPAKIYVHAFTKDDPALLYTPQTFADALITVDEDGVIGHCTCSKCKSSVQHFNKFCSHCGAKLTNKLITKD